MQKMEKKYEFLVNAVQTRKQRGLTGDCTIS